MSILNKIADGSLPVHCVKFLVNNAFVYYEEGEKFFTELDGERIEVAKQDIQSILDATRDTSFPVVVVKDYSTLSHLNNL